MSSFSGCRVVVRYDDGREDFEDDDCDVRFEAGSVLVTYFDERGPVVMQGREEGAEMELHARSRPRVVRLVREGGVLEGTWRERGDTGSLRIELAGSEA